jgi:transposase-like protein
LYRPIDKHGNPIDFLLTAKRDLEAAKQLFRKMLKGLAIVLARENRH